MTHPTDALRLVPHEKVRELAMQLARSIAGLGYPVGLGVAPPEDVCMKAAQGIFDLYLTAAPASPLPEGDDLAEFEIIQNDQPVASTSGPRDRASADAKHYAAVYGQDGPVEVFEVIRKPVPELTTAAPTGEPK